MQRIDNRSVYVQPQSKKSSHETEKMETGHCISVESLLNPAPPIPPSTYQTSAVITPLQNIDRNDHSAMIIDEPAGAIKDTPEGMASKLGMKNAYSVLQRERHIDVSDAP